MKKISGGVLFREIHSVFGSIPGILPAMLVSPIRSPMLFVMWARLGGCGPHGGPGAVGNSGLVTRARVSCRVHSSKSKSRKTRTARRSDGHCDCLWCIGPSAVRELAYVP